MMIQWTKLPLTFDAAQLREDVAAIPEEAWVPHFNQSDYAGEWSSVALRSKSGDARDIMAQGSAEEFSDTPLMAACPHLREAVAAFAIPLKAVRLLRLHPGSRIKEHRDRDLGLADGELRIHVPVQTNDRVEFIVANRILPLRQGEAWFIDFSQPHRIRNEGTEHRIHLVIDGTVNEWAQQMLLRSVQEIVTETFDPPRIASFRAFRELVWADAALQARLLPIYDASELLEATVAAGAERGYAFERADVQSVLQQHRMEWMMRSAEL
jgi:hypothetical protein